MLHAVVLQALGNCPLRCRLALHSTVAPLVFGKPVLNNVLSFVHAQGQKESGCCVV